jgi:hypothetical protein
MQCSQVVWKGKSRQRSYALVKNMAININYVLNYAAKVCGTL